MSLDFIVSLDFFQDIFSQDFHIPTQIPTNSQIYGFENIWLSNVSDFIVSQDFFRDILTRLPHSNPDYDYFLNNSFGR